MAISTFEAPVLFAFVAVALASCVDTGGAGGTTVGSGSGASTGVGGTATTGGNGGIGGAFEGGAGGTSGGGGGGDGGAGGVVDPCPDVGPGEPNETLAAATALAGGSDCDTLGVMGTIDGPSDVDWYTYEQTADEFLCNVKPGRTWSQTAGTPLRVCKYVVCVEDGNPPDTINCDDGSSPDELAGMPGCCHTEPFAVGIGALGCDGNDDLVNVYTRIDMPGSPSDTCTTYNLNYTF